jgi:hypothetical protein
MLDNKSGSPVHIAAPSRERSHSANSAKDPFIDSEVMSEQWEPNIEIVVK